MDGDDTRKRSVKTAETVFDIVELLADADSASLTTIADHLDMPRSTLHPYLTTLVDREYLRKDGDEYLLSFKFLDHGVAAQQNELVYEVSAPFLEQVAEETKEIVWLVVEEHGRAVCLRKAEGEHAIQPYKRIGLRMTMHDIASGKAILAELPDERVREIVDHHGLPARTDRTITDVDELIAELEEIRETGVAFNDGESMEGFRAVASPICPSGTLYGSLVVSGPKNRISGERFTEDLPDIVSGTTNALELELTSRM
ncbi:IclR family transcriptional regulator [Haloarchaeobius sp. HRN-SO-5]|uniref:IclR family transcriptional regulator n=1 Tax=Haloarchaeobius sp. HRN-SO-5 TaxID=3446118 RepID=UPI003EBD4A0E